MEIDKSHFDESVHELIDLLLSNQWPEAVPEFLICGDNEEERIMRGEGILDYIEFNLKDKTVCDFGCGEAHLAIVAAKHAKKVVGYDIKESGPIEWTAHENLTLTSSCNELLVHAPFDYVIVYDVLDHCSNPQDVLLQIKAITHSKSKVFIRFHSWMSRHATHLYRHLNKAWIHLIFTPEELEKMGLKSEFVYPYFYPIDQQNKWIKSIGFKVEKSEISKTIVEPFFSYPKIMERLPLNKFDNKLPIWQMSQSFNDYWLIPE